jgi:Lar family restriction alleviation protein
MPNEEVKLKPCPFCGGDARLQVTERGVAVVCIRLSDCGCRTDYYLDFNVVIGWDDWKKRRSAVEKAVEAWNRRAKDAE